MSRFKVSKYRNAFPVALKKEFWVHDLNVGNDPRPHSSASLIKASCNRIAFISDFKNIGSVSLLPLNSYGRNTSFPRIGGHSGIVNDFEFSFYNDDILLTGADDGIIKMWNVADNSLVSSHGPFGAPIDLIRFHTQVDNLLAFSQKDTLSVLDLENESTIYTTSQSNLQSVCWSGCGSLIGAISKGDKKKCICIYDPRQKNVVQESLYHSALKGSNIVWMGNRRQYITTGYDQSRGAEVALWSLDNNTAPIYTTYLGSSSGVPLISYDEDTSTVYACLKGETSIAFYELQDKDPYLSIGPNNYCGREQIKGMTCIPKHALNVMECEIARVLLLTNNAVIPISYKVQRKNITDFNSDLFPDTAGPISATTVNDWLSGSNKLRPTISLDPSKQQPAVNCGDTKTVKKENVTVETVSQKGNTDKPEKTTTDEKPRVSPVPPKKQFNLVRSSKVRYIEGKILHKDLSIQSIPKLSNALPGYCNGFSANRDKFAFYLMGNGGQIGVYEINDKGRMDLNKLLKIENGRTVVDFAFDPFDTSRLAVALDNSEIKVWDIATDNTVTAPHILSGHHDRICAIVFHPQAKDIMASISSDMTIIIWDLSKFASTITLGPLPEPPHSLSWSCNGQYLATLTKDNTILVFDPRTSNTPIKEGKVLADSRGGQLIWLTDEYILTTGFDSSQAQMVCLLNVNDLSTCLSIVRFGRNPAILIPFYDPDINVVFLTGRGDTSIQTMEININEEPYLFEAATFKCPSAHQGVTFLQKSLCDVKSVEVEYGARLCVSSVELFKFTIPRVKKEYFQDDLFPPTLVNWEHSMCSSEWLNKKNVQQKKMDLCPTGMKPLSQAPQQASKPKKYESFNVRDKTEQQKKEELISAMMDKMGGFEDDLLQEEVEDTAGVNSDEWDD